MPRKSSIHTMPASVRRAVDGWLKAGALTLDQMIDRLRSEYGQKLAAEGQAPPSRSALGRYAANFADTVKEARELREVARGWVSELGEAPDGDVGRMLVELMQALTAKTLLKQREGGGELEIAELWEFARTINRLAQSDAIQTKRADLIAQRAREALLREQEEKLKGAQQKGLISPETLATIRRQVYGLDA